MTRSTIITRIAHGATVRSAETLLMARGWRSARDASWIVVLDDLAAEYDDELLGAAAVEERPDGCAWLVGFALHGNARGEHGARLFAAVVDRVRMAGCERLLVDLC